MLNVEKVLEMEKEIKGKKLNLRDLKKEHTAIVVVDMVNGFVHEGLLASPRIKGIIKNISDLNNCTLGYKKIFFLDEHGENSVEYKTHGVHCKAGTTESQLISELREELMDCDNTIMIPKNSTNGFHAPKFKIWLDKNENVIENYIVVGCEADICVINFVITLKTYFNEKNLDRRIIVPSNSVETYDLGSHDGDLMKIISLYNMQMNGIEIVDSISIL
ncbi:isochorismatase family cysteine hydrolase [Clostridium sp. WILCCON 0269]|uniref:Isochorismatase family cysteine hydrolase n=1 Tax=Candidatus Clostridium eludens TaxID=3381663 RepID=A0ABW8SG13_9CLOT